MKPQQIMSERGIRCTSNAFSMAESRVTIVASHGQRCDRCALESSHSSTEVQYMRIRSNHVCSLGAIAVGLAMSPWGSLAEISLAQDAAPRRSAMSSGIEKQHFSKTLRAGEDFYRHVNDTWLETTEIPADQSNYGAFTALDIETKAAIRDIIESASKSPNPSPIAKQVGNLYSSYTDIAQRNQAGIRPIQPMLDRIRAIKDKAELMSVAGELSRKGVSSFFGFYIEPDAKRSDQYAVYVGQDGTTLPDRDYYLKDDERNRKTLEAYSGYIAGMLQEIDWGASFAPKIVDLETQFAESQWTQVQLRDPIKSYNKRSTKEFHESHPALDWNTYAKASGVPVDIDLIIGQPSFFEGAEKTLRDTDLATLQAYLAFQTINTFAPVLSESLEKKHFEFHETVLSGVTEQEPLWRRGVDACNMLLGMPVGQLYVEKHFTAEAKAKMDGLVKNLLKAFEKRIDAIDWMGQGTKAQAKQKLSMIMPKIGYPNRWKNYSSVVIVPDDVIANLSKISEFEHAYQLNKLGKPIDRDEWAMSPQIVNAYYNPAMNEIVFPAAILQPPFFNLAADDAVNYGGIGAVIGHEISHGFDDSGSKFDGKGNLRNWWTKNDEDEFDRRSSQLVNQYDAYEPIEGMHVQGKLTLGENIGDLGGLSVAYTAYKISVEGKPGPVLDGLTGDQRFFMGWAQVWRRKYRDQELRKRLLTDPHSPSQYRCNGIVSNMDAFYEAFGVKPGDAMYIAPADRVRIW